MNIYKRIYDDFFRPSKEDEYELILKRAKECGYEFHSIISFESIIEQGRDSGKKYLIIRRDIDTADFKICRKFLELEKKYGARASYYFRWNTIDRSLMKDIEIAGGEASYHYEEVASYCYKHLIRDKAVLISKMEDIRDLFIYNIAKFREYTGQKCLTVASHGDYVNTKLQYQSKELMNDRVRISAGIIREAYDKAHCELLTCRLADQNELDNFTVKALNAIENGEQVIELLTHPRQWNSPFWINLKEEISRIIRGLIMRL